MATLVRDPRKTERIGLSPQRRALEATLEATAQRPGQGPRGRRASLGRPDLVRRAQPCRPDPAPGE